MAASRGSLSALALHGSTTVALARGGNHSSIFLDLLDRYGRRLQTKNVRQKKRVLLPYRVTPCHGFEDRKDRARRSKSIRKPLPDGRDPSWRGRARRGQAASARDNSRSGDGVAVRNGSGASRESAGADGTVTFRSRNQLVPTVASQELVCAQGAMPLCRDSARSRLPSPGLGGRRDRKATSIRPHWGDWNCGGCLVDLGSVASTRRSLSCARRRFYECLVWRGLRT